MRLFNHFFDDEIENFMYLNYIEVLFLNIEFNAYNFIAYTDILLDPQI